MMHERVSWFRAFVAWSACFVCLTTARVAVRAAAGRVDRGDSPDSAVTAHVERFLSSTGPPMTSYRAFRTLEAETRGGQMHARLTAWTSLDPLLGFQYSIVEEDGSGAIRQRVLRAALEAERSLRAPAELARGALTASNYDFAAGTGGQGPQECEAAADGLVQIGIHPKRHDTMLLEGSMLLTESDGDLVRVEGVLIKRPSIWTRRVEIVRRYARIGGVRVPVSMRSTAQVLLLGKSTFSMMYEYESINGEPVKERPATGDRAPQSACSSQRDPD